MALISRMNIKKISLAQPSKFGIC